MITTMIHIIIITLMMVRNDPLIQSFSRTSFLMEPKQVQSEESSYWSEVIKLIALSLSLFSLCVRVWPALRDALHQWSGGGGGGEQETYRWAFSPGGVGVKKEVR